MTATPTQLVAIGGKVLRVFDDVLPDFAAYAARVRTLRFHTVDAGGQTFRGIADCPDPALEHWITQRFPAAQPTLNIVRRSALGQVEPNYVHHDADMGDWTAILYLNDDPPAGDGTIFWRDIVTGATATTASTDAEHAAEWATCRDLEQWEPWARVPAQPNRLVLFPATLFHSRALKENYGEGPTARLIQVVFGTGSLDLQRM